MVGVRGIKHAETRCAVGVASVPPLPVMLHHSTPSLIIFLSWCLFVFFIPYAAPVQDIHFGMSTELIRNTHSLLPLVLLSIVKEGLAASLVIPKHTHGERENEGESLHSAFSNVFAYNDGKFHGKLHSSKSSSMGMKSRQRNLSRKLTAARQHRHPDN